MLRILGTEKRFCDGLARRDLLTVGALAPFGLPLAVAGAGPAPSADASEFPGFGTAKRCILLCLWGSPSQLDTLDPKPEAPVEIRGELGSIATSLPGVRIGEILPKTAKLLEKVCIVRSLTHPYPVHGVAFATTSVPTTDIPLESHPRDRRHWPFIGSVVDYLASRTEPQSAFPRNFGLPFAFGSKRGSPRSGPFGGFLGQRFDPVYCDFRAKGTKVLDRDAATPGVPMMKVADPYAGILPTDRFELVEPVEGITLDRIRSRESLSRQLDSLARKIDASGPFEHRRSLALALTASGKLSEALDIQREPPKLREQYGMTLFGQSCLAARRVLEAGGKFVTVFWDEYGLFNTGWDTHIDQNTRLRDELGPGLDAAYSTLLLDLEARGMLGDTAVVLLSEHGRTPRIQNVRGAGRDHWSGAYSAAFAGAGFARGKIVGRTNRIAGDVEETPVSPKDILATLYHLLGVAVETELYDREGRAIPVAGDGQIRRELLQS